MAIKDILSRVVLPRRSRLAAASTFCLGLTFGVAGACREPVASGKEDVEGGSIAAPAVESSEGAARANPRPAAAKSSPSQSSYTRQVAIILYDGVELLDFAGPGEVFAVAGRFAATNLAQSDSSTATKSAAAGSARIPAFEVYTVARSTTPILSQGFLRVIPDYSIDDAPVPDILVLPGGGTGPVLADPPLMKWITASATNSELTLTVCTGASILGKAGLLDGRDVTTFYGALEALQARAPKARVHPGRRFVDSGDIVTTAGVSAGIDGSLHVVARLLGRRVADETARYMEYAWHPEPYLAKSYATLNPSLDPRGRRQQEARLYEGDGRIDEAVAAFRELLEQEPTNAGLWYELGGTLHRAGRLDEAMDAYRRAAEEPALRSAASYDLACAHAQRHERSEALAALKEAVKDGSIPRTQLEADPDLASLREDPEFRDLLASLK